MWVYLLETESQITGCTLCSYLARKNVLPVIKVNYMTQNSWNDGIFLQIFLDNKQIWVYCLTLPENLCW